MSKDLSELSPLSHLVLVVDEFTELKRFSSESNDVDFIAEITTIARVGRTLGFHIILVSQNIEGAITDDIRVNSKARICLKVATKQASKEMIGTPAAAAPTMPLTDGHICLWEQEQDLSIFSLHTLELIKISILIRQSLLLKQQIQVNSTTDSIPQKDNIIEKNAVKMLVSMILSWLMLLKPLLK